MQIGYAHVQETLGLAAFAPGQPARVMPVTRVQPMGDHLAVPARMVPGTDDPLAHLLFALKHEGVDLAILMEALTRIPGARLLEEIRRTPNGSYARIACFLWEQANRATLDDAPIPGGAAVPLFPPDRYVTGPAQRNPRWRVDFNGLGSLAYCATVERTPAIAAAIASDLPGRANAYAAGLDDLLRDRALAWAYLHETADSFAIERETPSEERARAFVALLHQAHQRHPLSQDYLVGLQQATVANPLDRAASFRQQQNWLQGPQRGAAGVSYLPPPPEVADELMEALMAFANGPALRVDPLVAAAVVSFGFVLIHPFMDGNGRLSRFLFHHALCRTGALADGLILPVSVAMKKHEPAYLRALQTFSVPARQRWAVEWLDAGNYAFRYRGDPQHAFYRYWNATACVEFGMAMAERALEVELKEETTHLQRYDCIVRRVNDHLDVRGSDLATLVISCIEQGGTLSRRRRDQFRNSVPEAAFDLIEAVTREVLATTPT